MNRPLSLLSDDELKHLHWDHTERYTLYQQEIDRIIAASSVYNPMETEEETARMDRYRANVMKQLKRNRTRAFNVYRQILYRDSRQFLAHLADLRLNR
jgi:hypothetical protein